MKKRCLSLDILTFYMIKKDSSVLIKNFCILLFTQSFFRIFPVSDIKIYAITST